MSEQQNNTIQQTKQNNSSIAVPVLISITISAFISIIFIILTASPTKNQVVNLLESDLKDLKQVVEKNKNAIKELENDNILETINSSAIFTDLTSESYAKCRTGFGSFLISIKDIKPYLDGQEVTLKIGNLTSIQFSGFGIEFAYGNELEEFTLEAFKKSVGSLKKKKVDTPNILYPGEWNTVTVKLLDIKASELRLLIVNLIPNRVNMSTAY